MVKKIFFSFILILLMLIGLCSAVSAKNETADFCVADVTIENSETAYMNFSFLGCSEKVLYMTFDIILPEGFVLNSYYLCYEIKNTAELLIKTDKYTFRYRAGTGSTFYGGENFLRLNLYADDSLTDGEYPVQVENLRIVVSENMSMPLTVSQGTVFLNRDNPCKHTCNGWTVTKAPTYESEGERVKLCTKCNAVYQTKNIAETPRRSITDCKFGYTDTFVYTGKKIKPKVSVTYKGIKLTEGEDYTVTCSNNRSVGEAKITVTGKGAYRGKKILYFTIKPKSVKIKSIRTYGNGKIKLTWTKSAQADGYRIYMKTGRNGKYKLIKTVKDGSVLSYKTGRLKQGKKYYFKIKAYTVSGKQKIFSSYSGVKSRVL